jgi:hypothetical protein
VTPPKPPDDGNPHALPPELPSPELAACQESRNRAIAAARTIIELDPAKHTLADAQRIAQEVLLRAVDVNLKGYRW